METIEQIKATIEKIRPYINRDGGDVEFVSYEDGVVKVKMLGACVGCMALEDTLFGGIESFLREEVPGIKGVELDTSNQPFAI